jgi:hypothetical protein
VISEAIYGGWNSNGIAELFAGEVVFAQKVDVGLELGVAPDRIDTIIDFAAAAKHGVKTEGNSAAANAEVLAELAGLIDAGRLEIPIAKVYRLADVREAYQDLARLNLFVRTRRPARERNKWGLL